MRGELALNDGELRGDAEQLAHELRLSHHVILCYPFSLCLSSPSPSPRFRVEFATPSVTSRSLWQATFAVSCCGDLAPQYCLVLTLAQTTSSADCSVGLKLRNCTCIGRVLIHIDDTRHRVTVVQQSTSKESLGGCRVAPVGQEKVDRLACGIDSSVQKTSSTLDADVCLIQPPASVCPSQVRTAALVHFRTEHLNPTPNAAGRNCQSAFGRHLGHVCQRNRVSQIPSDAPQNNVTAIVPPLEWIRGCNGQHSPYQPCKISQRNLRNGH